MRRTAWMHASSPGGSGGNPRLRGLRRVSDLVHALDERLPGPSPLLPRAVRLLAAVEALHAQKDRLDKLRIDYFVLALLGSVAQENPDNEKVGAGIQRLARFRPEEHPRPAS